MTQRFDEYRELINSNRVSPQTREALLSRLTPDDPAYVAKALTAEQLTTLRSVLARVIPQRLEDESSAIDLAARLDTELAEAKGDGWRYAALPSDIEAYRVGLALLDEFAMKLSGASFADLLPVAQDSLLAAIACERLRSPRLDLKRWFEDVRAGATRIYVSHPETLARMGYSGIADDQNGFVQLGMGEREAWEPEAE